MLFIRNTNANRNLFVATLIKKSRLPVFPLCDPKVGSHFCSSYNCILWSQNRIFSTILVEQSWAFYKRNTTFKNAIIFWRNTTFKNAIIFWRNTTFKNAITFQRNTNSLNEFSTNANELKVNISIIGTWNKINAKILILLFVFNLQNYIIKIKIIKKNRDVSLNATLKQTRLLFIRNTKANAIVIHSQH